MDMPWWWKTLLWRYTVCIPQTKQCCVASFFHQLLPKGQWVHLPFHHRCRVAVLLGGCQGTLPAPYSIYSYISKDWITGCRPSWVTTSLLTRDHLYCFKSVLKEHSGADMSTAKVIVHCSVTLGKRLNTEVALVCVCLVPIGARVCGFYLSPWN